MSEKKDSIDIFDYDKFDWSRLETHSISGILKTPEDCINNFVKSYGLKEAKVIVEPKSFSDDIKQDSIGVVYSGGYDSTVLMLNALLKGETVKPIIFNFSQDDIIKAINLSILKSRFGDKLLAPVWFGLLGLQEGMCAKVCTQQLVIHNYITYISDDILKSLKEIQIGYVMNDDAVSFQDELKNVVSTGFQIQDKTNVPVTYPLIQKHKYFIDEFISQHLGKNHLCLSCELPDFQYYKDSEALYVFTTVCNKCHSCAQAKYLMLNFYNNNNNNDNLVLATRIPFAKHFCF